MSDILSIGKSAINSYQTALSAISENVANASTAGYTRRTVTIEQVQGTAGSSIYYNNYSGFAGSRVASIGRAYNQYQAADARAAASDAGSASAKLSWLTSAQTALGNDATGVGQSATAIFNAGDTLASNPNSTSSRQAFLNAIDQTASAFRTTAGNLATVSTGIANDATTTVQSVNAALAQLDKINVQLNGSQAGTEGQANLLDQRDQVLSTISSSLAIDVTFSDSGAATVGVANGGPTLVAADKSTGAGANLSLATDSSGRLSLSANGGGKSIAIAIAGGAIGGQISAAGTVADRRQSLDAQAAAFATQLNAWNANGTTAAGTAGTALLSGSSAATLTLATSDPTAIAAAASDGTANGNLLALSGLRTSTGVEAQWNAMITDQGQAVANATTESSAAAARSDAATTALAAGSGVDLDTEAAELIRYQQAYSGAAKVIQVARDTLQSILDVIN